MRGRGIKRLMVRPSKLGNGDALEKQETKNDECKERKIGTENIIS